MSSEARYAGAGCFQGDDNQNEYVITSVTLLRVLHIKHVASSMQASMAYPSTKGFSFDSPCMIHLVTVKAYFREQTLILQHWFTIRISCRFVDFKRISAFVLNALADRLFF